MGGEQRVRAIRLLELGAGHRGAEPAVVGLSGELQHPARNRDGHPACGQLFHERVDPFPGRFACDRYAAARRRNLVLLLQQLDPPTCFPQFHALLAGRPGLHAVVDVRAAHPLPQRHRVDAEVGGHLLDRDARAAVPRDPHNVLAELLGIRQIGRAHV